ncbi:MAG: carbon-nitrogen hydrolase family protein [Candidatus Omnitrophica bacterium]|nr:carbon-nitrogen hydrolase family protein [Candidatus Omnitrophota bacterium]
MKKKRILRVACIQNNAGNDPLANLKKLETLTVQALARRPDVVALPEAFLWRGSDRQMTEISDRWLLPALNYFKEIARKKGTAFLLGGIPERTASKHKSYNTAFWIAPNGRIRTKYQKIHLYDVSLDSKTTFKESTYIASGRSIRTVPIDKYRAGLSICYDLRFPELFRRLTASGAQIIFLPANFTAKTGKAHWRVLLKARAIENQVFMVAPGQVGRHPVSGVLSYGHSMIINPWGDVLAEASGHREEIIWADLDMNFQARLRHSFPVLKHQKRSFLMG